ncbi:hypothetical protein [Ewingella americana]|uniref:Uncharacterized protein n=1 Tax=Ewingella americana TaxID=41202 RepID=A0A502GD27_9GAMM|nr:hypothetical protein [Ewingella americana]TPG59999.1 hypothetical protein EAH77_15645 [Ewingella americana]
MAKTLNVRIEEHEAKLAKLQEQLNALQEKGKEIQFDLFNDLAAKLVAEEGKPAPVVYVSAMYSGWSYAGQVQEVNRRAAKIQWADGSVTPVRLGDIHITLTDAEYKKHIKLEEKRDAAQAMISGAEIPNPKELEAIEQVKKLTTIKAADLA